MAGLMRITADFSTGQLYSATLTLADSVYSESYSIINNVTLYPRIVMGQKFLVNLKLLNPVEIPASAVCKAIVDNDYNNDTPYLPLQSSGSWDNLTGSEWQYANALTEKPQYVRFDGVLATEGTLGSLTAGQWCWIAGTKKIVIRLASSNDPNGVLEGYIMVKYTAAASVTVPFIENDETTCNLPDTWFGFDEDTGVYAYRDPVPADGEFTFEINADTLDFYTRMGTSTLVTNTTMQVQILDDNADLHSLIEFFFVCRNKYIGNTIETLDFAPTNFYSKAEITSLLRAGRDLQFSIDGSTLWHDTQADEDHYWRERYPDGEWGDAIEMIQGDKGDQGDPGNDVEFEYSIDGSTLWHTTWVAGDKYIRQSTDGGSTWGAASLFVGPAVQMEYSVNGTTLWHTTFVSGDLYQRVSVDSGVTWSSAMRFVANLTKIQYSIDGATLWHDTFTNGDLYLRISVDGGTTWGDASLFVATVKDDLSFVNADLSTGILTVTGVVPIAAIVDNNGKVIIPNEITYATNTTVDLSEYGTISGTWRVRFAQGGTTGPQGIPGATPALTIGTVTSGTPAAATITGTALNPVLNMTIPPGATGATPDITVEVETGDAGTDASVEVTGTAEEPVITFTIPRGDAGADGAAGLEDRTSDYTGEAANSGKMWMRSDLETPTVKAVVKHAGGSYDSNTKLMMHMDGANDSTTFTISQGPSGITAAAVGNAKISTAQSVFGGASALFDGTGDYVELSGASTDFAFGTGDFTIEWRMRQAADGRYVMGCDYTSGWLIYSSNGALRLYVANTAYEFNATVTLNTWAAWALVRSGTTLHLYKDGVEVGTGVTCAANITAANPLWIGNDYGHDVPFNGYLDEIRISNNARRTGNYTVDAVPFAPSGSSYTVKTFTLT